MATTQSPTASPSESPRGTIGSGVGLSTLSTARSVFGSRPSTLAGSSRAVAHGDGDLLGALDDVVVGEDDAVAAHDEAGAGGAPRRGRLRRRGLGNPRAAGTDRWGRTGRRRRTAPGPSSAASTMPTVRTCTTAGAAAATMSANDGGRVAGAAGGNAGRWGEAWAGSVWVRRPATKPPAPRQRASAPASTRRGPVVSMSCPPVGMESLQLLGRRTCGRDVRAAMRRR